MNKIPSLIVALVILAACCLETGSVAAQPSPPILRRAFTAQVELSSIVTQSFKKFSVIFSADLAALRIESVTATGATAAPSAGRGDVFYMVLDARNASSFEEYMWSQNDPTCRRRLVPSVTEELLTLLAYSKAYDVNLTYQGEATVRRIASFSWQRSPFVPVAINDGKPVSITWHFAAADWTFDVAKTLKAIPDSAAMARLLRVTVDTIGDNPQPLYELNVVAATDGEIADRQLAFRVIDTCNTSNPFASTVPIATAAPEFIRGARDMPRLPAEFSAVIETTMIDQRLSFTAYESFSGSTGRARLTVTRRVDAANFKVMSVVVSEGFQTAYQVGRVFTPSVNDIVLRPDGTHMTRHMFAPTESSCSKNVFNERIVGDIDDLMMVSRANGPRYMGRTVVRGVSAMMWDANIGPDVKVTWYFSDAAWVVNGNKSATLLRVVIKGRGQSPFFVHHPFLQRGQEASKELSRACSVFLDGLSVQCAKGEEYYTHVHEIVGFVPFVDTLEFGAPAKCNEDKAAVVNVFPTASNCPDGLTSASIFVICIFVAIFSGLLCGLIVYGRMRHLLKKAAIAGSVRSDIPATSGTSATA